MPQIPCRVAFTKKDKECKDVEFQITISFDKKFDDWAQEIIGAYQQAKQYLQRSYGPDFDRIIRIGPEHL